MLGCHRRALRPRIDNIPLQDSNTGLSFTEEAQNGKGWGGSGFGFVSVSAVTLMRMAPDASAAAYIARFISSRPFRRNNRGETGMSKTWKRARTESVVAALVAAAVMAPLSGAAVRKIILRMVRELDRRAAGKSKKSS